MPWDSVMGDLDDDQVGKLWIFVSKGMNPNKVKICGQIKDFHVHFGWNSEFDVVFIGESKIFI